ncbi:MAG TPA: HD domain-containing phosphohydrolase, partial [Longilinea sp.]|nr:HD domain-containing phosphohydrolase [Longilinea sp.]
AFIAPMLAQNDVIGLLIIESRNNFAFLEEDKEWFGLVANQIGLAIQNARLFVHAQQRIAELSTIQVIDSALLSHLGHNQAYDLLTAQTAIQLKTDSAILLLYDETNQELHLASIYGYQKKKNISLNIKLGESLAGKVALERKRLHFDHLKKENLSLLVNETLNEGFDDYYGLPLLTSGKLIGVLEVMHRTPIRVDEDWFRFLDMLAEQSAIVIDTIQLYDGIQLAHQDLVKAYDATIEGWSQAMDLRDRETEGHTQRVVDLTLRLAHKFGFSEEDLVHIRRGCLLHDIGKLGVPDAILLKADKLTDEEWVLMKKHPEYAYSMLKPIEYLAPAIDIPYCHHEKWDGSGYPRGLKGEEIPLAGRLFAIVDVWDALLSNRPYRKAWTELEAFEYMKEQSGKQFDPQVVSTFLGMATKPLKTLKLQTKA